VCYYAKGESGLTSYGVPFHFLRRDHMQFALIGSHPTRLRQPSGSWFVLSWAFRPDIAHAASAYVLPHVAVPHSLKDGCL